MRVPKTRNFPGVEILDCGVWNASTGESEITPAMLAEMARAYRETRGRFHAPVKLGHEGDQPLLQGAGYPAAGWVENVRVVGSKLVADLMAVPEAVAGLIESAAYRARSAEVRGDFKVGDTTYP